jgi:hypothetical protein
MTCGRRIISDSVDMANFSTDSPTNSHPTPHHTLSVPKHSANFNTTLDACPCHIPHAQAAIPKATTPASAPTPSILGPGGTIAPALSVGVESARSVVAGSPREAAGSVAVATGAVDESAAESVVLTPLLSWARVVVASRASVVRRTNFMLRFWLYLAALVMFCGVMLNAGRVVAWLKRVHPAR